MVRAVGTVEGAFRTQCTGTAMDSPALRATEGDPASASASAAGVQGDGISISQPLRAGRTASVESQGNT